MARTAIFCAVAAMLCACVAAQGSYLEVVIKWDNTLKQTQGNDKAIQEEIAKELCGVPKSQVKTIGSVDKSSTLNTESWGYYACTGTADQVTKAAQKCGNNQRNFKDELEDRTTPDHEAESIKCTVKSGAVPTAVPASGRRMAM